jgi:hypothetical protein
MESDTRKYTYLQEIYSREHKDFIKLDSKYRRLYLTDIDRLWIERGNDMLPLALVDLKWHNELYEHNSKIFDHALITGFVKFCFYILCHYDGSNIIRYDVIDYLTRETIEMQPSQYAEFLYTLRDNDFAIEYKNNQKQKFKGMNKDELSTLYPNVHDVFFKNSTDNKKSIREEKESLHDYYTRRNMRCFCKDCINLA